MPSLSGSWLSDQFSWSFEEKPNDELSISIVFLGKLTKRAALQKMQKRISEGIIPWLRYEKRTWWLDMDQWRKTFPDYKIDPHWHGTMRIEPEVEETQKGSLINTSNTLVLISVAEADLRLIQHSKIFLSHKGEDKKMVRRFQRVLETLGFEVWLDEKNLKAGDHLERGILEGFEESCAAVFFITEKFKDERYLKAEIDHAIAQKRSRDDFRIITLAFKKGRESIEIPKLLKSYVWKSPATELDALIEILKALPIAARRIEWK